MKWRNGCRQQKPSSQFTFTQHNNNEISLTNYVKRRRNKKSIKNLNNNITTMLIILLLLLLLKMYVWCANIHVSTLITFFCQWLSVVVLLLLLVENPKENVFLLNFFTFKWRHTNTHQNLLPLWICFFLFLEQNFIWFNVLKYERLHRPRPFICTFEFF